MHATVVCVIANGSTGLAVTFKTLIAAILLFAASNVALAEAQSPQDQSVTGSTAKPEGNSVIGVRIVEGVHFADEIWLRGVDALISLNLATGVQKVHFAKGVIDVEKAGEELWVLRSVSPDRAELTVSVLKQDEFEDLSTFPVSEKQAMIALFNYRGGPAVLSQWSVIVFDEMMYRWRTTLLKAELDRGVQISVASPRNGGSVYIGYNMGEFGGGVQALDVEIGAVTDVTHPESEYIVFGGKSRQNRFSTITSLLPHPEEYDCILASTGLVHFLSWGGIWKICGSAVSLTYEKRTEQKFRNLTLELIEPFFGLIEAADSGYWALSASAVYHFEGRQSEKYDLEDCRLVAGVCVSDAIPGMLVVKTDINNSVSLSGYTPLIVPLEE